MKIIFFGTANVALPILEKLNKQHQVLAVVTNPDAAVGRSQSLEETPVSALTRDLKLPTFKPETVKDNQEFIGQLKNLGADVFVVVAFGTIMPAEVINMPPLKTINVHFSALPKYRGPSPIQSALLNGDKQTGTTIFILDEQIDHGPLLAQKIADIEPDDNYFTLSDRLAHVSADLLMETLSDYQPGKITPLPRMNRSHRILKLLPSRPEKLTGPNQPLKFTTSCGLFTFGQGFGQRGRARKLKFLIFIRREVRRMPEIPAQYCQEAGFCAAATPSFKSKRSNRRAGARWILTVF